VDNQTPLRKISPIERNFPVYELPLGRFNCLVTEQKKIFGTDGVRGVANVEPVTAETALKLGRAAAYVFALSAKRPAHSISTRPKKIDRPGTCSDERQRDRRGQEARH